MAVDSVELVTEWGDGDKISQLFFSGVYHMNPLSPKLDWSLANPQWAASLNPILNNPTNTSMILKNQPLINGVTIINHGLGRLMQGWIITDINGAATIYRSAPFNNKTLTLTSNAIVTVSIEVF